MGFAPISSWSQDSASEPGRRRFCPLVDYPGAGEFETISDPPVLHAIGLLRAQRRASRRACDA